MTVINLHLVLKHSYWPSIFEGNDKNMNLEYTVLLSRSAAFAQKVILLNRLHKVGSKRIKELIEISYYY